MQPSYDGDLSNCQVSIQLEKTFTSYSLEREMLMEKWTNEQI